MEPATDFVESVEVSEEALDGIGGCGQDPRADGRQEGIKVGLCFFDPGSDAPGLGFFRQFGQSSFDGALIVCLQEPFHFLFENGVFILVVKMGLEPGRDALLVMEVTQQVAHSRQEMDIAC